LGQGHGLEEEPEKISIIFLFIHNSLEESSDEIMPLSDEFVFCRYDSLLMKTGLRKGQPCTL